MITESTDMITKEMQSYAKGYEDARSDEIAVCIQSLQREAKRLSRALPELAEGIQIAAEILVEQFERRSARAKPSAKKKNKVSF